MTPCAIPSCPAYAAPDSPWCPAHAYEIAQQQAVDPDTARAIAQRDRIARMYGHAPRTSTEPAR